MELKDLLLRVSAARGDDPSWDCAAAYILGTSKYPLPEGTVDKASAHEVLYLMGQIQSARSLFNSIVAADNETFRYLGTTRASMLVDLIGDLIHDRPVLT